LCDIVNNSWAIYNNVNFGAGTLSLKARVASDTSGGTIQLRLGNTNGPLIGTLTVANTGGWQTYATVSTTLTGASGIQNVALRFVGGSGYLLNVEWLEFTPISTAPVQLGWQLGNRQFQFTWPADHTGWRLVAQTNAPGGGMSTNWVTVPGSTNSNTMSLPLTTTNGSVFFRLVFP
jgi:hypothetical protein